MPELTRETLLTVAEIAEALKLSKVSVYRLISKGTLPHHRIGGSIRVTVSDLDRLMLATYDGVIEPKPAPSDDAVS